MGSRWIYLPTVVSTNTEAARLLACGEIAADTILYTDYQEGGKGRGDHVWESEAGKNLLMSWVVFPAFLSVDRQFMLSKLVAVAITDVLSALAIHAMIKWPNDILVGGRKIGGVLLEHSILGQHIRSTISGIGLNINQTDFPDFDIPATSLVLERGTTADRDELLKELAARLQRYYGQLAEGQTGAIDRIYHERLYGLGRQQEFVRHDGTRLKGVLRGVNALGELLVEREGTTGSYGMHELRMLLPGD